MELTEFVKNEAFAVSEKLLGEVESYIDEHYIVEHKYTRCGLLDVEHEALEAADIISYNVPLRMHTPTVGTGIGIDEFVGSLDEPFSDKFLRLIDAKGKTDVEIYKHANLDRKLFSKIKTGKCYTPSKCTAIVLSVALELSLDETDDLLARADYT